MFPERISKRPWKEYGHAIKILQSKHLKGQLGPPVNDEKSVCHVFVYSCPTQYHRPPRFGRFGKNFQSSKSFDKNCYGTFWFMKFLLLQKIESLEASKSNTQYLLSMFYAFYILPHNQSIFNVSLNVKSWVRTQSYLNWSRKRIVNNPSLVQESHQPGGSFTTSSVWVI